MHCVSATGRKIINKKIKRAKLISFFEPLPRCVVGMEASRSLDRVQHLRRSAHIDRQARPKPDSRRDKRCRNAAFPKADVGVAATLGTLRHHQLLDPADEGRVILCLSPVEQFHCIGTRPIADTMAGFICRLPDHLCNGFGL